MEEDIKREVEDIKMKLKVKVEDIKIGEVEIEDLNDDEALLGENAFEGELSELAIATEPHPGDFQEENMRGRNETRGEAEETAKDLNELCNLSSMPCQREELDFCQDTFDLCFQRTVALAESIQWSRTRTRNRTRTPGHL